MQATDPIQQVNSPSQPQPRTVTFGSLPTKTKWVLIACVIYLALPIDVVPMLGIVGDLTALFVAMSTSLKATSASQES